MTPPGKEKRINSFVSMGHLILAQIKMYRKGVGIAARDEGITPEEIRAALERAGIAVEAEMVGLIDPEDPIMAAMKAKAEEEENEKELTRLLAEKAKRDGGGPRI